jgi:hypothetical protein
MRILSYFVRNPEAADTYEGIVRWRLMEEAIHYTTAETQQALVWLVSNGYLNETASAGAGSIYSLNQTRRADAEVITGEKSLPSVPSPNQEGRP